MKILNGPNYLPWNERPIKAVINYAESTTGDTNKIMAEVVNGKGVVTKAFAGDNHELKITVDGVNIQNAITPNDTDENTFIFFENSIKVEALGIDVYMGHNSCFVRVFK